MRALNQILFLVFVLAGGIGYVYLYPRQAGFLTKTDIYRFYVGPHIDRLFSYGGRDATTVAYLVSADGEINHRPASELVALPAYDGQRFGRGTLVSTGSGANAMLALVDNTQLLLEPNSTILLEAPGEGSEVSSITLRVVGGSVTATKSANSKMDITLVTPKGTTRTLSMEKIAVVAPRKVTTASQPDALRDLGGETDEFVGKADRPLAEIEQKLLDEKRTKLDEVQKRIETAARDLEQARLQQVASVAPPAPVPQVVPDRVVIPKALPPSVRREEARRALASAMPAVPLNEEGTAVGGSEEKVVIPETVSGRRRDATKRWQRPPTGNDISEAFYASRAGSKDASNRILARSLTRQGYASNEAFADTTRIALDSLLEGYVVKGNGKLAVQTLKNAEKAYATDPTAQVWATGWRRKLADAGYETGRAPASQP